MPRVRWPAGRRLPGAARVHDGEEIHAGYGATSVQDPLPVTERTLFQVFSLRADADADADAVTVRMLLTHTAGFHGDWSFVHRAPVTARTLRAARQPR